jgi:hypothetical protein
MKDKGLFYVKGKMSFIIITRVDFLPLPQWVLGLADSISISHPFSRSQFTATYPWILLYSSTRQITGIVSAPFFRYQGCPISSVCPTKMNQGHDCLSRALPGA